MILRYFVNRKMNIYALLSFSVLILLCYKKDIFMNNAIDRTGVLLHSSVLPLSHFHLLYTEDGLLCNVIVSLKLRKILFKHPVHQFHTAFFLHQEYQNTSNVVLNVQGRLCVIKIYIYYYYLFDLSICRRY